MFADIKNDIKKVLIDLFDVDQDYLQSQINELMPSTLIKSNEYHISIKDL